MNGGLGRRALAVQLARLGAVAAIVALIIISVPGLATLRTRLGHADPWWVAGAGALEAASVIGFTVAFVRAFADRLGRRSSVPLALTAQGINVLIPAGGTGGLAAVSVLMARLGLSRRYVVGRMVALFVITGVLVNVALVIVAGFGVGAGLLPGDARPAATLAPAAVALGLTVLVAWLVRARPPSAPRRSGGVRRLLAASVHQLHDGLTGAGALVRSGDPLLLAGAAAYVLLDLGALALAFRSVGSAGLPIGTMALAYTLGQIGSVVPLPGTTEGGLLGVFLLYGAPLGVAASAIIVYRAAQSLVPLSLGLLGAVRVRGLFADDLRPEVADLALDGPGRRY
jgi:uncharacterized membrane protein YbhN (UPF0104 family)